MKNFAKALVAVAVFFNALSGTVAYAKSKRIDYKLELPSRSQEFRQPTSELSQQPPEAVS